MNLMNKPLGNHMTDKYAVRYYPMSLHSGRIFKDGLCLREAEQLARDVLDDVGGFVEIVNSDGVVHRRLENKRWNPGRSKPAAD